MGGLASLIADVELYWWGAFRSLSPDERRRLVQLLGPTPMADARREPGLAEMQCEIPLYWDHVIAAQVLNRMISVFDESGKGIPTLPPEPKTELSRCVKRVLCVGLILSRDNPRTMTDLYELLAREELTEAKHLSRSDARRLYRDRYRKFFEREIPDKYGVSSPRTIGEWRAFAPRFGGAIQGGGQLGSLFLTNYPPF